MSLDHKAFAFDWTAFSKELLPLLSTALARGDPDMLVAFVDQNVSVCRSPYDGQPLSPSWRGMLEANDIQELADFALTKYYDPTDDHGLSEDWMEIDETLSPDLRTALLGRAIPNFDPGRQGSYFVQPAEATVYAAVLRDSPTDFLRNYGIFLGSASSRGLGMYVTF